MFKNSLFIPVMACYQHARHILSIIPSKKTLVLGGLVLGFTLAASPGIAQALVDASLQFGASNKVKIIPESSNLDHFKDKDFKGKFIKLSVHGSLPIPTPIFDIGIGLAGSYESYDLGSATFEGFNLPLHSLSEDTSCSGVLGCLNLYSNNFQNIVSRFLATATDKTVESTALAGTLNTLKGYTGGPQVIVSATIPGLSAGPFVRGHYVFAKHDIAGTVLADETTHHLSIPIIGRGLRYAVGAHFSPIPLLSFFVEHEWSSDQLGLSSVLKQLAGQIHEQAVFKVSDKFNVTDLDFKLTRRSLLFGVKAGL